MADTEEATVEQLAKLYNRHEQRTTGVQRLANRITWAMGRPLALVIIFGIVIAWTAGNYAARSAASSGYR